MNQQLIFFLNQAIQYIRAGNFDSAELMLRQALKLPGKNPEVLRLLGVIEAKKENYEAALGYLSDASRLAPKSGIIYSNKGNALQGLKRYEEAIKAYDQAIMIEPNYAEAYSNKGNALQGLKRYEEAIGVYDQAIMIEPNYAEAYSNKGNALQGLKRYEEAIGVYDQAILIEPNYAEAYNNKGNALQGLKRYEEAIGVYDQAIMMEPNYAEAYNSKGSALVKQALYSEGLSLFEKATTINPEFGDANFNIAVLNLKFFQFGVGWEKYIWRWNSRNFNSLPLISSKGDWSGQESHKKILVWAEQGIGDQILFGSMFSELKKMAPNLTISVDRKLLTIFRRSFPQIEFIDSSYPIPEDSYDEQISMGALGGVLRGSIESFKKSTVPYLVADEEKTAKLKSQIHPPGKSLCGISWRSANKDIGEDKSIPISDLAPLLMTEKFKFINLQYGDVEEDLKIIGEMVENKVNFIKEVDLYGDVDSALSLIDSCDLIVTSSNSTAHMAGALSKKTILILPFESGKIWYWHVNDGDSLWYPSVKIFSQTRQGDWTEVIERVKIYMESLSFE
ncbi:tetratricopeptide repeat protein [Polynucleobacter sp. es-MAR-4]|uniref:tetratricopeptide repeat-containing glycosyltransferase family protein n=1 Tax=Polynucleobacter sp. es-MAR-4 TaxID=1855655 RepID=UPI001C0B2C91|nr:tetratricopeptide repeat-containing glycosyltransferase family protein [Polynucleobacter sp. es-MAR-4]MBU3637768.1 glycosyltransferase family protein [Polynucleobacter sp. es-MAR-4]